MPTSLSRPFNPSSLRPCGATRFACLQGKALRAIPTARCLAPLDATEPAAPDRPGQRPAAMGRACGATPRLAAAGCAKACRPRRWRFAPVRHEGRFTDTPPGFAMEHPRHASTTSSQSAARSVLARRWGIGLARVRAQAGEAVMRGCRVGHVSIRERAAGASLACRESWRGNGCALGFMAATFAIRRGSRCAPSTTGRRSISSSPPASRKVSCRRCS